MKRRSADLGNKQLSEGAFVQSPEKIDLPPVHAFPHHAKDSAGAAHVQLIDGVIPVKTVLHLPLQRVVAPIARQGA